MSEQPMRTRRSAARVPGFPQESPKPVLEPSSPAGPDPDASGALDRRGGTRQLNVRLLAPLMRRYKRFVRDLEGEGFETSMTELVHALLHDGPETPAQARAVVRRWRNVLDPPE